MTERPESLLQAKDCFPEFKKRTGLFPLRMSIVSMRYLEKKKKMLKLKIR
jgi:hypothetical protein